MKNFIKDFPKTLAQMALAFIILFAFMGSTWKNDPYVNREQSHSQVLSYSDGVSDTYAFPAQAKHVEVRWITVGSTGQCNFDFKTDKQDPVLDGSHENWVDASILVEHVDINSRNINFRGVGGSGTILVYATW